MTQQADPRLPLDAGTTAPGTPHLWSSPRRDAERLLGLPRRGRKVPDDRHHGDPVARRARRGGRRPGPAIDRTLADLDTLSTSRNQNTLSDAADRLQTGSQAMVTAATAAIGG